MKNKIIMVIRILAGIFLIIIGADKLVPFFPHPPAGPGGVALKTALQATGYLFYLVGVFEIIIGVLFVMGRYIPLALVLLAPLSINFIFYHIFLDPANIGGALGFTILNLYLAWEHREAYRPLLRP